MKNFTIINNEECAIKKTGYKLDFKNDHTHHMYEDSDISPDEENKLMHDIDSFYDLYDAVLCTDENGEMYAVEFHYATREPVIWQKVTKA